MVEELIVKIKLIPDSTAIDKYLSKLGKTSIAMRGVGNGGSIGGKGGAGGDIDDSLKKNLKIFKADLLLRWIKRIWQIAEKNIPFANVLAKMNNSLIRLFLFPIMMRIFKILLPIYRELFKLAQWWVTGGFEKVLGGIFSPVGEGKKGETTVSPIIKLAPLLQGTFDVILKGIMNVFNTFKTKIETKLGGFVDDLNLKPISEIIKKNWDDISIQIGRYTSKITTFIDDFVSKANKALSPFQTFVDDVSIRFATLTDKLKTFIDDIVTKVGKFLPANFLSTFDGFLEKFGAKGASLVGGIGTLAGKILTNPANLISLVGDVINIFGELIKYIAGDNVYLKSFGMVLSGVGEIISTLFGVVGLAVGVLKTLWNIGILLGNALKGTAITADSLILAFDPLISVLKSLWASFMEVVDAFANIRDLLKIPSLVSLFGGKAVGGPVSGGKSYLVGEKGPEIFTPGVGGNITPNNKMGGGTSIGNINVTINATKIDSSNMSQLAKDIGDKIYSDVRRRVTF